MEKLLQDVRFSIRSLIRQPAFTLTVILTLALGIGATTAIFSVVNALLLKPLTFEESDRIVSVQNFWVKSATPSLQVSAPDFRDWVVQSQSFESMGYYIGGEWSVTINNRAEYAMAFRVTPGFLQALRAKAALGRLLTSEEQRPGGPLALVVTHEYWLRQFGGHESILGATVKLDDRLFTIVGVLEPGTRYPARAEMYYPAWVASESGRSAHNHRVIARLRDGVSLDQARGEMTAIAARLAAAYPASNQDKSVLIVPLQDLIVSGVRQTVFVLFGAVVVVLLIACANVANLLLARASVRSREMVVRSAVGASRGRLIRQLLTESALLGLVGGLLGVWLARFGVLALVALAPATFPRLSDVRVDSVVLVFALSVALLASFLFGLAPALHVSKVRLSEGLRQGGKGSSTGARTGVARSVLVVAEIALAVVLVVGAGMLIRSFVALTSVNMGFDSSRLLVLTTAVPLSSFAQASRATDLYRELLADVRRTPGVESVAGVRSIPSRVRSTGAYSIEGAGSFETAPAGAAQAVLNVVTPGYFETLRVPLRRGRDFASQDRKAAPMVAIVNEALVRQSFPGEDPIGRRIQCGLDTLDYMTIVGIAADVRTGGPASPLQPEIFMPVEQHPGPSTSLNIVVRAAMEDPMSLVETIRRKVTALNPDVPIKASTMEGTLGEATGAQRFQTFLLGTFAAIALLLALAGVYGVMSYTVSQRVPELGVRIALGATPRNILGLIVAQGARLALIGLALGIGLALLSGRLLDGLLFGVTARDPWSLFAVSVLVAVATLAACYIPGRRAVRVDPMTALRAD
ncbi:MAG: ABC transporter permease [Acidobacteriota bacterium]|nr:ABC transporter permease [Acidobacteriota bacterium]